MKKGLLFAIVATFAAGPAQLANVDYLRDFVVDENAAYGMKPPMALATDIASLVKSNDGSECLCVISSLDISEFKGRKIIAVGGQRAKPLELGPIPDGVPCDLKWLGPKAGALVFYGTPGSPGLVRPRPFTVELLNLATGSRQPIFTADPSWSEVHLDPGIGYGILSWVRTEQEPELNYAILRANGRVDALPAGFMYHPQGTALLQYKLGVNSHRLFDPNTMREIPEAQDSPPNEDPTRPPLEIGSIKHTSLGQHHVDNLLTSTVKDADPGSAYIATDSTTWIDDRFSAIFILRKGLLIKREIFKMDIDAYRKAAAAAESRELLNIGKQCAIATLMYSADYDDEWPLSGGFVDIVNPYIRNGDFLSRFNYSRPGQSATNMDDPSKYQLGTVNGKYGQAIVYADGHVKWKARV